MPLNQEQLDDIFKLIAEMGGHAEMQLAAALQIFSRGDASLVAKVESADKKLDALDVQVNDLCFDYMMRHSPMAGDLRAVLAAIKISLHLERIGDYAKNVAVRGSTLHTGRLAAPHGAIVRMGQAAMQSLSKILNAIAKKDAALAQQIWLSDSDIDAFYTTIFADIVQTTTNRPMDVGDGTHMLFIARNIERIGDHIGNIAEILHFWITGARIAESRPYYEETSRYAHGADAPLDGVANANVNIKPATVKKVS